MADSLTAKPIGCSSMPGTDPSIEETFSFEKSSLIREVAAGRLRSRSILRNADGSGDPKDSWDKAVLRGRLPSF